MSESIIDQIRKKLIYRLWFYFIFILMLLLFVLNIKSEMLKLGYILSVCLFIVLGATGGYLVYKSMLHRIINNVYCGKRSFNRKLLLMIIFIAITIIQFSDVGDSPFYYLYFIFPVAIIAIAMTLTTVIYFTFHVRKNGEIYMEDEM